MHIVGGVYREICIFPEDDVIYGSGGRAAAALSALCPGITLSSFVGEQLRTTIEYHASELWRTKLCAHPIPETLSFLYRHGLSTPLIRPKGFGDSIAPSINVCDDTVLQFGMLEGGASVQGRRVIYDPQNPRHPEYFNHANSTADELAYVLNSSELLKMTGRCEVDSAAKQLLALPNVEVVVVKLNIQGARVYLPSTVESVCAYATNTVWPIGSGDVFSAVFAYYWGARRIAPKDAAAFASRAAALYCRNRRLPLQPEDIESSAFSLTPIRLRGPPSGAKIYIAGPFFTMAQLWMVEEVRKVLLAAGYGVFSPYHDVGLGSADRVAARDIAGIEECSAMFAICDGVDPGTYFEIGYAVKKGIPVVALGEQTSEESMKMVVGTGCCFHRDFASAIYRVMWGALS